MLQKYRTDAALLLDEYAQEFSRDMSLIENKVSPQREAQNQAEDTGDSLILDSDVSEQEWKKTEDGWERTDSPEEPQSDPKPDVPSWAKKLYRKIALIAHPDRMSKDYEEERLRKIFLETSEAMTEGNFDKLLGFALELDIPATEDDASMVPLLQKRVNDLKTEISAVEKSIEWLWGEGLGVPVMRANLARAYFSRKGIILKTDDLISIIQEMEKENESKD